MDERENLPAKLAALGLAATTEKRGSLVARGMVAVLANHRQVLVKDNDARYRQAREVYNRLTDDGLGAWSGYEEREAPLTEALNTFLQLAAEGYGKAYYPLSTLYGGDQSIKGDPVQAERFRKLAFDWLFANQLQNDPEIWNDLGKLYLYLASDSSKYYGNGNIALLWFLKAANMGDASAMWHIGMYDFGFWVALPEGTDSLYWQIEAAKAGHEAAQHGLEQQHEHGDLASRIEEEQIYEWYVWSAEQRYLWAQLFLAEAFHSGYLIEQDDEQAAHWYLQAAEQGHAAAQFNLGLVYDEGQGVPQDYEAAAEWFRKAAEQGHAAAQFVLGSMYDEGRGVPQDYEAVAEWFRKAAEQGHVAAQFELGFIYTHGRGVPQNYEAAAEWFRKAAEQGLRRT